MILKNLFALIAISCNCIVIVKGAGFTGPTTVDGLNLIKSFESFEANFYIDAVGIKTIGYGYACHANPCNNIKPPLTKNQAESLLLTQLKTFESCINTHVKGQLNGAQFSALVSFAFNVGCNAFKGSTLLRKLNGKDVRGAADEFARWNKGKGKVLNGLTKRRAAERKLFCSNNVC